MIHWFALSLEPEINSRLSVMDANGLLLKPRSSKFSRFIKSANRPDLRGPGLSSGTPQGLPFVLNQQAVLSWISRFCFSTRLMVLHVDLDPVGVFCSATLKTKSNDCSVSSSLSRVFKDCFNTLVSAL